jgi:RNA polymerase primary sigma factor
VRVEVYETGRQYRDRTPTFSRAVNVEELQPHYCKMLRAYRDGATAERLGNEGEVVAQTVPLTVPKRDAEPKHREQEHEAVLLVMGAADDEAAGRLNNLAMFRGPGMVVESKSLSGLCLGARPFYATLLCGRAPEFATGAARGVPADPAAEEFLRTAEPPSHNKWMATPDLKSLYARGCKTRLEDFLRRVQEAVRELVKPAPKDLGDGPQSMKELFKLGPEPPPTEHPRVTVLGYSVDEQGRWQVKARVRLKPRKERLRLSPTVAFLAETGSSQPVGWEWVEPVSGCTSQGSDLLVEPDTRVLEFRGSTDPKTHPVPARDSCAIVDIRKVVVVKGGNR